MSAVGELLQSALMIVTLLVMNNLAAAYGDGPLAAMGVAVRIAQIPEFLIMGITLGVLPLLAYSYGKGDRSRLTSALRTSAYTVGGVALLFAVTVFVFRDQVFTAFVTDRSAAPSISASSKAARNAPMRCSSRWMPECSTKNATTVR